MTVEQPRTADDAPDAGRVGLHPLSFEEALRGLVAVDAKRSDGDEKDGDGDD